MKSFLFSIGRACLFVTLSPLVIAQGEGSVSCDQVQARLDAGVPAAEIVRSVVTTGMSQAEATVFAMDCAGEDSREAIAVAGVAMVGNLAQAQSVADAVWASAGQTGPVADAVQVALQDYLRHMPPPDVYEDKYTPTGGNNAVSPAT